MIVRPDGSSRLAITQPDHAALAGRIMNAWHTDGLPDSPRRAAILYAVAEHDYGWLDVDAAPEVDGPTGALQDFMTSPDTVRRGVWTRALAYLESSPYAAALVAHHAWYVYGRYRSDPTWAAFFPEMTTARDRLLRAAGLTLPTLLDDYRFVRIGDLISLTFCAGWTDAQTTEWGYTIHPSGARVTVTPDPFSGASVAFTITARTLPSTPFHSTSEAREAFARAPIVSLSGIVSGR